MSNPVTGPSAERAFPARPNLEHLKNEAKQRLATMRRSAPKSRLTQAQFALARDYGFASWRALKAEVERRGGADTALSLNRYVGYYREDPVWVDNAVVTVAEEHGRLSIQTIGGAKFWLTHQAGDVFVQPGLPGGYEFEGEGERAATLTMHTPRGDIRFERADPTTAEKARADFAAAMVEQAKPRTATSVPAAALDRCVGFYSTHLGPAIEVSREGDHLFAQVAAQPKVEIFPETETDFFYSLVPLQLAFVLDAGRAEAVIVHQNGLSRRVPRVSADEAQKLDAPIEHKAEEQLRPRTAIAVDPALLAGYVGRYQMGPQRVLEVTAENGRLYIQATGQPRFEVYPETERDFFWTAVAAQITFVTGPTDRAAYAILHQAGRDLPLGRVEAGAAPGGPG
jgi:hypothetical protein